MDYAKKVFRDVINCDNDHISEYEIQKAREEIMLALGLNIENGWDYEFNCFLKILHNEQTFIEGE